MGFRASGEGFLLCLQGLYGLGLGVVVVFRFSGFGVYRVYGASGAFRV